MDFPSFFGGKIVSLLIDLGVYEENDENIEVIEYGLILFLSCVLKSFVIFLIALFMGLIKEFLICSIAFGLLRSYAGGVHAKTSLGCLFSMLFIYFATIYLSIVVPYSDNLLYLFFIICLIIILLYAPADVAEKPILDNKQKMFFKIYSVVILVLLNALSFIFFNEKTSKLVIISCVLECITLLPLTYRLTRTKGGGFYE